MTSLAQILLLILCVPPLIALVEVLGSFGVNVLLEAAAALPEELRRR